MTACRRSRERTFCLLRTGPEATRHFAKQLACVDVLSEGQLIFGTAAGYLEPEPRAVGVPWRDAARTDEHLAATRSPWHDDKLVKDHGPAKLGARPAPQRR
ncbi:hypothetical protein GCM10009735_65370 [Actinomadura chokoriensis]